MSLGRKDFDKYVLERKKIKIQTKPYVAFSVQELVYLLWFFDAVTNYKVWLD